MSCATMAMSWSVVALPTAMEKDGAPSWDRVEGATTQEIILAISRARISAVGRRRQPSDDPGSESARYPIFTP